jgi:ABC-2 type transport system permease protein
MSSFGAALYVETLKALRARAPRLIALSFMLAPLMGALFMFIIKNPERARAWGLIGAKAQFAGSVADWPAYFELLAQAVAIGGAFVFGMITTWVFGREFADRTAKELLALPTPRAAIITAKFAVVLTWTAIVTGFAVLVAVAAGHIISLPRWSAEALMTGTVQVAVAATLTVALLPVVAFVASAGQGYLAGIGWIILTVFLAQIVAIAGWGAYFPWSVPALASGAAGRDASHLPAGSYLLVILTSIAGAVGTFFWWHRADHTL